MAVWWRPLWLSQPSSLAHFLFTGTKCWKMGSGEPVGLVLGDETRSPPGLIAIEDQVPAPAPVSLAVP